MVAIVGPVDWWIPETGEVRPVTVTPKTTSFVSVHQEMSNAKANRMIIDGVYAPRGHPFNLTWQSAVVTDLGTYPGGGHRGNMTGRTP